MTTETLSKTYLELALLLPKTVVSARENALIEALIDCVMAIRKSTEYKADVPELREAHDDAESLLHGYGR